MGEPEGHRSDLFPEAGWGSPAPSGPAAPTGSGWTTRVDRGPGPSEPRPTRVTGAAQAASTIGKVGRTRADTALQVAMVTVLVLAVVGSAVFVGPLLLILLWPLERIGKRRDAGLDAWAWSAATPTRGAHVVRTHQVSTPVGLDRSYRHYRWWSAVDEHGSLGLFGVTSKHPPAMIITGRPGPGGRPEPRVVAPWWSQQCQIFSPKYDSGLTALHYYRESPEPLLAVRLRDHDRRGDLEALVYAPEEFEDLSVTVLSCLAVARLRVPPTRSHGEPPAPWDLARVEDT